MAARINPKHDEQTRLKIQTSQLINRLIQDAMGEIELSDGQRKSIDILLRKSLPDLARIEHSGEVTIPTVMRAPLPANNADEWQSKHVPLTLQ